MYNSAVRLVGKLFGRCDVRTYERKVEMRCGGGGWSKTG